MAKKWVLRQAGAIDSLQELVTISDIVKQMLVARGITSVAAADAFLNPRFQEIHDPFLFNNMSSVVTRIQKAREEKELVTIYGDYDADGVSGTATIAAVFKRLDIQFMVYLPHREKEGYGLNNGAVDFIHEKNSTLMITNDCGISNYLEVEKAKSLGIDVIVTDHHDPPARLPDCLILHPSIEGEAYPFKYLAGGGVAYKLAQALLHTEIARADISEEEKNELRALEKWIIDLPTISTVADMVPLVGENRVLVKYGLVVLNKTRNRGLQQLLEKSSARQPYTADTIGFQIAPRINAAGRMDHANVAFKLLHAQDDETAQFLAEELERNNSHRQKITRDICAEALEIVGEPELQTKKIVAALGHEWSNGLLGLVASRLVDRYHVPVMVVSKSTGEVTGSARSIPAFNFIEALHEIKHFFSRYGGHPAACGFTLKDPDEYLDFVAALEKIAEEKLKDADLTPVLELERELAFAEVSLPLLEQINLLEPYGMGNPKPLFMTTHVRIQDMRRVGADEKHLKLELADDTGKSFGAIGFGFGSFADDASVGTHVDIAYELDINEWNGYKKIQLRLVDIRLS